MPLIALQPAGAGEFHFRSLGWFLGTIIHFELKGGRAAARLLLDPESLGGYALPPAEDAEGAGVHYFAAAVAMESAQQSAKPQHHHPGLELHRRSPWPIPRSSCMISPATSSTCLPPVCTQQSAFI